MKRRFRDVIDLIEYDDLIKINKDIDGGAIHLKRLVEGKIKEHQKSHNTQCSECLNQIDPNSVNNFTLMFGPDDFKKKATFCGLDCMEYFIHKLKNIKEVKQ